MGEAGYPIPCFERFQFCAILRNDRKIMWKEYLDQSRDHFGGFGAEQGEIYPIFPLNVTSLKWPPLTTFDDFFDPPPTHVFIFQTHFSGPPSESLEHIQRSPPFKFLVTTDPPFCSPKN